MADQTPEKGDKGRNFSAFAHLYHEGRLISLTLPPWPLLIVIVSWNWGGGAPGGTVAETKKEGEIAIKSKRGNTIKKNADPGNPAVHVERAGNDVVKRASELNIETKASNSQGTDGESTGMKRKGKQSGINDKAEDDDAGEDGDSHVRNDEGNEVRKGGKKANKKQKRKKEDVKGQAHGHQSDQEDYHENDSDSDHDSVNSADDEETDAQKDSEKDDKIGGEEHASKHQPGNSRSEERHGKGRHSSVNHGKSQNSQQERISAHTRSHTKA
jgi:hypothetical protein